MPPADDFDVNSISIAELAGVDMTAVKEVRSEKLPAGTYRFQVDKFEDEKDKGEIDGAEVPKFVTKVTCKVVEVKSLGVGGQVDPATLIGKLHVHRISKNIDPTSKTTAEADVYKFMGMVKAFATDIGVAGNLPFGDMKTGMVGRQFDAPISHQVNRNNKDQSFANLTTDKIKKVG